MSKWITYRLPTEADADEDHCVWWTSIDGEVVLCYYEDIKTGEVCGRQSRRPLNPSHTLSLSRSGGSLRLTNGIIMPPKTAIGESTSTQTVLLIAICTTSVIVFKPENKPLKPHAVCVRHC